MSVSKASFRIAFDRDDLKRWPARDVEAPEERIVDDPREAAEVAVEMATAQVNPEDRSSSP